MGMQHHFMRSSWTPRLSCSRSEITVQTGTARAARTLQDWGAVFPPIPMHHDAFGTALDGWTSSL